MIRAALAFVFVTCVSHTSMAADRAAWFKSLRQPDTGFSCCDVSDCKRTEAVWKNDQWWARVDGEQSTVMPMCAPAMHDTFTVS